MIKQVIAIGLKVISKSNIPRKNIKSSVWGKYTNGKKRTPMDALRGETVHPKERIVQKHVRKKGKENSSNEK